jgi:undecaprenyl-diphosphatase
MILSQAIFLGIIQGLTEFLPVSSSGHLFLIPTVLKWDTLGLAFDTALHLGTLGALLLYFRKDLLSLISAWVKKSGAKKERSLGLYLILATLPAAIMGVLFEETFETTLRDPRITISMLVGIGLLFLIIEGYAKKQKNLDHISLKDALTIGICQVAALVPGVSRSGSTMLAALTLGYTHKDAARFSFLLGIPIVGAAGIFKLKDLVALEWTQDMMVYFFSGVFSSFLAGLLCISFFLKFLEKHSFRIFGWYRIIFGLLMFGLLYLR